MNEKTKTVIKDIVTMLREYKDELFLIIVAFVIYKMFWEEK